MTKTFAVQVLCAGLWLAPLYAQQTPAPPAPALAGQFLGFSETQSARFQQLLQALQSATGSLEQQMAIRQQRLETLLNSDQPDPSAVGAVLVELRNLQKQAGRAIQNYHEGFLALLTPEQMQKAQAVIQAGQLLPAVRAFAEVRLIEPPH
jgi:Spy/CpxP family protein refolding chaperone